MTCPPINLPEGVLREKLKEFNPGALTELMEEVSIPEQVSQMVKEVKSIEYNLPYSIRLYIYLWNLLFLNV